MVPNDAVSADTLTVVVPLEAAKLPETPA
jgi:hypothetical protein